MVPVTNMLSPFCRISYGKYECKTNAIILLDFVANFFIFTIAINFISIC